MLLDLLNLSRQFVFLIFLNFVQGYLPLSIVEFFVSTTHHGLRHHAWIEGTVHILVTVHETIISISDPYSSQIFSPDRNKFLIGPSRAFNTVI